MLEEALRKIGLTEGEAMVYLALLELGATSTGAITKQSGISGSKVYEVLDRLAGKGLVAHSIRNNVKHFEAAQPTRILDYLEEKKAELETEKHEIQKVIPDLALKQSRTSKSEARIFSGWHGLRTANEDIIDSLGKGEEWLSMGLSEQPKALEAYFTHKQKERARKGIIHKHLLNEKYRALYELRKRLPHTEFRFLPKALEMPTSTEIYGEKVIIMLITKDHPMAIMIESKEIADSFRKYFYALWATAKVPKP